MALNTYNRITITNSGLTYAYTPTTLPDVVYIVLTANLTLSNDVNIYTSIDVPEQGTSVIYYINGTPNVDLNGYLFQIEGSTIDEDTLRSGCFVYLISDGSDWSIPFISPSLDPSSPVPNFHGKYIVDGTVLFSALETLNRGSILVGNSSNEVSALDANDNGKILIGDGTDLNSVSVTGDVTINSSGVTAIGSGVIVNGDVSASAGITRSKLASGTADYVVINDGSGVMSQEAQLSTARGGLGADISSSTGFIVLNSGSASVGAITEYKRVDISFVTAAQGTYYVKLPACTVTAAKARVTSTISGTDDGSIVLKDATGTTMTGGSMTITASSAHGTGFTCTPSANNSFTAGQEMQITVSKTTSGGTCSIDITYTRTALT